MQYVCSQYSKNLVVVCALWILLNFFFLILILEFKRTRNLIILTLEDIFVWKCEIKNIMNSLNNVQLTKRFKIYNFNILNNIYKMISIQITLYYFLNILSPYTLWIIVVKILYMKNFWKNYFISISNFRRSSFNI